MSNSQGISRRAALQTALSALALGATSGTLAAATPSQVEGPFFPTRDQVDKDFDLTRIEGHPEPALGEVVEIAGQVLDEDGAPVAESLVDVWQANTHGRYAHEADPNPAPLDPNFQGWAQLRSDGQGRFRVRTIVPGAYPVREGWARPPHIHFKVARRGYHELITQMYFAGQPLNDVDRLLQAVPESERGKLVVSFSTVEGGAAAPKFGRFELVLRRA